MLGFFPSPYQNEILYSVLARYHLRSGNNSPKITLKELFGDSDTIATADLHCNLDALIRQLPIFSQLNVDDLIANNTLYNFYTPFIPPERATQIKESMKSNYGGNIHTRIGLSASNISQPKYFRFCPQCLQEDEEKYGEFYWHRIHQLSCVLVCPTHNIPLQNSTLLFQQLNQHHYQVANRKNCMSDNLVKKYSPQNQTILFNLARDVQWLFDNPQISCPLDWYYQQYMDLLMSKNIATASKRVNQKKLFDEFLFCYGQDILSYLDSSISLDNQSNWLFNIARKHRKSFHPIRHILMMRFLCGSVGEFFERTSSKYKPFGNPPWICFNGAVDHYLQPVIEDVKLSHCLENKKPLGTFTCSCGMVYSRTVSESEQSDGYKPNRIITYGDGWHQKLQDLVENKNLGLRAVARELKVTTRTINRYVNKFGLNASWQSETTNFCHVHEAQQADNKAQNRQDWIELQKHYPEATKTQLRNLSPALYARLYRGDRPWLNNNSPSLQKPPVSVNKRVDWEKRDQEVKIQVENTVQEILQKDKPERVTLRKVGIMTGLKALLEHKLDKLPLTKTYLQETVESVEMFQDRRIQWAIALLEEQGEEVKSWKVKRFAGITDQLSEKVEKIIDSYYSGILVDQIPCNDK